MDFLPALPLDLGFYGRLAALLAAAVTLAELGERTLRLPRITGYLLAGMLLGPAVLGWIPPSDAGALRPLAMLGLGLLLFELGSRVNLGWLRNNPMLLVTSLVESSITFATVYGLLTLLEVPLALRVTVAAIAVPTGPAVVMRIVADSRARGQVTERLLMLTGLNTIYGVLLLTFAYVLLHLEGTRDVATAIAHPLYVACGSLLLATGVAVCTGWALRYRLRRENERFVLVLAIVLISAALGNAFKLSTPLALLLGGMLLRSFSQRLHIFPEHMGTAGAVVVVMLFALVGATLDPQHLLAGGALGLGILVVRALSKAVSASLVSLPGGLPTRKATALGLALLPISNLSLLQAYDVAALYPRLGGQLLTMIVSTVVVMELLGPIATQFALRRAGETSEASET